MSIDSLVDDGAQNLVPYDKAKIALFNQLLKTHTDVLDLMPCLAEEEPRPEFIGMIFTVNCGEGEQQPENFSSESTLIFKITAIIQVQISHCIIQTKFGSVTDERLQTLHFDEHSIWSAIAAIDFEHRSTIAKTARNVMQESWENNLLTNNRLDLVDHFTKAFDRFECNVKHVLPLE